MRRTLEEYEFRPSSHQELAVRATASTRFDRLLSIRTWLFALAAVPLLGSVGLVYGEFGHMQESRADAQIVEDTVTELVQLTSLRTSLVDEKNWTGLSSARNEPPGTSQRISIAETTALKRAAAASVDAQLGDLAPLELRAETQSTRGLRMGTALTDADYLSLTADIEQRTSDALETFLQAIGRSPGSHSTLKAFRTHDASSRARQLLSMLIATELAPAGPQPDGTSRLAEYEHGYRDALERIAATDSPNREIAEILDRLTAMSEGAATDLASLPTPPLAHSDPSVAASYEPNKLTQLEPDSWRERLELHDALQREAAIDFEVASQLLSQRISGSVALGLARIGVLLAASFVFVFVLATVLGRPLHSLANGARVLRDGAQARPLKPSGPTEVRQAMLAINEAAAHIKLAERQARVLAEGQLADPVLDQSAPGALGRSLQDTVRTLTSSLNQREEFRRRLSHEATHDGLTQLSNRKASLAQLKRSVASTAQSGATLAVMFIDLDGFKEINDNHGHSVGDAVLWTLGKRLKAAVREGDHVGRLGGDEFLVIANPVRGPEEARQLAERLTKQISEPMDFAECTVSIHASIGLALTDPLTSLTATDLLYNADLAVYRAKELGRNRVELCDDALHRELLERTALEDALRRAIPRGELTMHYQPILDANTARLSSLEALIRWERPGHGMVSPDVFIPIAERSDLIREVDNWVVGHVIEQLRVWTSDPYLKDVPIAINISGRHLSSETLVSDILGPIQRADVDPTRLILEVTESALVDDLDLAAAKLRDLRDNSLRIAIDDFGTGYTSLGHLRSLPIDILKIDRSFINDPSASSLVKLIIDTGHLIGVRVTCEGIETAEQAAQFTDLGTDALQGYLFARPMPAASVAQQISTSTSDAPPFLS